MSRSVFQAHDPRILTIHHVLALQVIRGAMPVRMECAPAFNYARSAHDTTLIPDTSVQPPLGPASPTSPSASTPAQLKAFFSSPDAQLTLDLRYIAEATADAASAGVATPRVQLRRLDLSARGHKGPGVFAEMDLIEGQVVTFILRTPPDEVGAAEGREQASHHEVSHDRARELGIPLERLVLAKSKLRAPEDPVLTRVRAFNYTISEIRTDFEPAGAFARSAEGNLTPSHLFIAANLVLPVDKRLLEWLDPQVVIQGFLEGVCPSECARAQAPHLRTYRCHRGQPDIQLARVHRGNPELVRSRCIDHEISLNDSYNFAGITGENFD